MEEVLVELNPGFLWEQCHSKTRKLFSPANWI